MYSEFECGICYRTYNAGRRCPRELRCKHSFCESCLLALSRPLGADEGLLGADRSIVCPLCRHATSISEEGRVVELRVDECVLERLLAAGVLDQEGDDPEEEEGAHVRDGNEEVGGGGRLRRSWRKVWRKISGKSSRQRGGEGRVCFFLSFCFVFIDKGIMNKEFRYLSAHK